ncbi:uncharacterized protein LOC130799437 [Amaranthus tricolor]|uniref:uncharacterized protein LOC130799437 n=1 Tax=Amaranthus tricolor TaxID=29722 RepID=UPI0025881232|nr:uncharacterized protein LOC130799437 [Amaranthus tricolor]
MFLWSGMRKDIGDYVSRCLTCQKVKSKHKRPRGLLQPLEIPVWKWNDISMDFIVGLPRTKAGNDALWVILDRLTKSSRFIPMNFHGWADGTDKSDTRRYASIQMAPFEALYGRLCRSPVYWGDFTEAVTLGPELWFQMTEKVRLIRDCLKAAQDRQKSFADLKR